MRRWWQTGERSVDDEARWIAEAGLDFALDEDVLTQHGVVLFRGRLALDGQHTNATLIFPTGYLAGEHPVVSAPDLDIGRHRAPDGTLCLTHDVLGSEAPMTGAEAIERAQHLWQLWENDRDQLQAEEADAPDPWANYVDHARDSAVALVDVDVTGGERGYLRASLTKIAPMRGVITEIRVTHPATALIRTGEPADALRGAVEVNGSWLRLAEHPPETDPARLAGWLQANHKQFIENAISFARNDERARKTPDLPGLVAFVYPDEGPRRGETHDAWLFVALRPSDGAIALPRPFHLRRDERWLRQPELQILEERSLGLLGAGALGSQVGAHVGRAGVGGFTIVDSDIYTAGNRVRHDLDLSALGHAKALGLADRLRRINPWVHLKVLPVRFGGASTGLALELQRLDDRVADALGGSDIIVNASAHGAAGSHCSRLGSERDKTVVHVWVSAGAWGGRILVQRPSKSACWDCLGLWQETAGSHVPDVAADPAPQEVLEGGCADLTFTGANFEIAELSAAAARVVIGELVDAYPVADYDLATFNFRFEGNARTEISYTRLGPHPDCTTCRK